MSDHPKDSHLSPGLSRLYEQIKGWGDLESTLADVKPSAETIRLAELRICTFITDSIDLIRQKRQDLDLENYTIPLDVTLLAHRLSQTATEHNLPSYLRDHLRLLSQGFHHSFSAEGYLAETETHVDRSDPGYTYVYLHISNHPREVYQSAHSSPPGPYFSVILDSHSSQEQGWRPQIFPHFSVGSREDQINLKLQFSRFSTLDQLTLIYFLTQSINQMLVNPQSDDNTTT